MRPNCVKNDDLLYCCCTSFRCSILECIHTNTHAQTHTYTNTHTQTHSVKLSVSGILGFGRREVGDGEAFRSIIERHCVKISPGYRMYQASLDVWARLEDEISTLRSTCSNALIYDGIAGNAWLNIRH